MSLTDLSSGAIMATAVTATRCVHNRIHVGLLRDIALNALYPQPADDTSHRI